MVPTINLRSLKPLPPCEGSRERTLEALARFQAAQERLEKVCAEKGIPVPVMVC